MIIIPLQYKIAGAAALVCLLGAGHLYRVKQADSAGYDRAVTERAARDGVAIIARAQENAAVSIKQDGINAVLTKVKNDEIATLRARLAAERMRRPAFCSEPAGATQAKGTGSGNVAYPGGGVLPDRVAEDIQALILKTEEAAATGRACQSFVRENGMAQ